jgi:ribosomal protein S12 methylthiotransferase accessory factor
VTGLLADAIEAALSGLRHEVLVTATDSAGPAGTAALLDSGWLPVRVEPGAVLIGPLTLPGTPGCPTCVRLRRDRVREHAVPIHAVLDPERPYGLLTELVAATVAALVADEVAALPAGRPRSLGALLRMDLDTLAVSRHPFLPDPLCPDCGDPPADTPPLVRLAETIPVPAGRYRVRSVAAEHAALLDTYVDAEAGLIRPLARWTEGGVLVAAAPMGLRTEDRTETGFGLGETYPAAEAAAIAEALERYGGITPGGRRTTVYASWAQVREHAADPRSFGLYPPQRYDQPGFAFTPFDESLPCHWVWGWSLVHHRPVLIPEAYAYYHTRLARPDEPRFAYEISNGCAVGGRYEEAVLHGILEIAERDAFLLTWYRRTRAPEIDLAGARGDAIGLLLAGIGERLGYRVRLFDITVEQDIPAVWALASDVSGRPDRPAALCSAAAHPDQEQAVVAALRELAPALAGLLRHYPAQAARAAAMAVDPSLVREMDDHGLLYACPQVQDRFDFLTVGNERRALRPPPAAVTDLRPVLDDLVDRYARTGMDVMVVDQTTPEHRAHDLHCVKVLIPGTVPMTFGHDQRRDMLPRIGPDPNPHPHPFP